MEGLDEIGPPFLEWLKTYTPGCLWVCGAKMRDLLWAQIGAKWKKTLRVVSYANVEQEEDIAGVRVDYNLVGRGAVDLLTAMVMRGETGLPEEPKRVSFRGTFIGEF